MNKEKKVLLGVTGSIAAFKAAALTSALAKDGCQVKVVMTKEATHFVTPLTFQTLSGNPVYQEMFAPLDNPAGQTRLGREIKHISLAEWPDIILVCPATANIISKVAAGLADDLLSAIILATRKPVYFVPSMNAGMWQNQILQKRVAELKTAGYRFIGPGKGRLACGEEGEGRMVEVEEVMAEITRI
jgi:phosphopantothenoylcysteine decarboxylase/phosphopantothenate--cysteine ligase